MILFFVKPMADFPDEPKNNEANLAFFAQRSLRHCILLLGFDPQLK